MKTPGEATRGPQQLLQRAEAGSQPYPVAGSSALGTRRRHVRTSETTMRSTRRRSAIVGSTA